MTRLNTLNQRLRDHYWLAAALAYFGSGAAISAAKDGAWIWFGVALIGAAVGLVNQRLDMLRSGRLELRTVVIYIGIALCGLIPLIGERVTSDRWPVFPLPVIAVAIGLPVLFALIAGRGGDHA